MPGLAGTFPTDHLRQYGTNSRWHVAARGVCFRFSQEPGEMLGFFDKSALSHVDYARSVLRGRWIPPSFSTLPHQVDVLPDYTSIPFTQLF